MDIRLLEWAEVRGAQEEDAKGKGGAMNTEKTEVLRLEIVPINFDEACDFVKKHHRHHTPPVGHKFSIAVALANDVRGVAISSRPTARHLDDGWTLEVTRLATDGAKNACSMLYAASWRAARAMGYRRMVTFILDTEPGTTLEAAGWKCIGKAGGAHGPVSLGRELISIHYKAS